MDNVVDRWRLDYNHYRPHSMLGWMTPASFAARCRGIADLRKVMELGGHVRVGFEDSPFLSNGKWARNNMELVENAAAQAEKAGRKVVGPSRAREIIGLRPL